MFAATLSIDFSQEGHFIFILIVLSLNGISSGFFESAQYLSMSEQTFTIDLNLFAEKDFSAFSSDFLQFGQRVI